MTSMTQSALIGMLTAAFLWPGSGRAAIWTEINDAPDLPGTAQITTGTGPLEAVQGTISANPNNPNLFDDIDLYRIKITDPSTFVATTVNTDPPTAILNPMLWLFDSLGRGIILNDNFPNSIGTLKSELSFSILNALGISLTAGEYLIAITVRGGGDDFSPSERAQGDSDPIFKSVRETSPPGIGATFLPIDDPGMGPPLDSWGRIRATTQTVGERGGSYQLELSGVEFARSPAVVPLPSTGALFILGMVLILGRGRKRKALGSISGY